MTFFSPEYDPWWVVLSILIASGSSYVALDLAKRVRTPDRAMAIGWWAGGSVVMGSGIWSMHFVGMLAFTLPVALGYTALLTIASWVAGVIVSGIALGIAGQGTFGKARIAVGAIAMGTGICAMHYLGMAALDMAPGIVWDWPIVAASAAIAVLASGAALWIFSWLERMSRHRARSCQAAAAVVMGLAISGMHYTGMAAANFPAGSVCLSAGAMVSDRIGSLVVLASILMLGMTWLTSTLDARMQDKATILADSLQEANTQLRNANDELRRRTLEDRLTALANRELFEDRLRHAIARWDRLVAGGADPNRSKLAVLFVDLDGFKPVNDSFGHGVGDVVLKEAAQRLARVARRSDTVARVGGDEFLLLVEEVGDQTDCVSLAQRIVADIRQPFQIGKQRIEISASVGIAIFPDHGRMDKLVSCADSAMYAAKRAGGNSMAVYESHMESDALSALSLQGDLRRAVERGELQLYYQPKIDGLEGRVHGVEALVRWNHPDRGVLSPSMFIPLAERFGLIGGIGNWVIEEACRQMRDWLEAGMRMRVAINLSAHQLREPDLVERIGRALSRERIDPSCLLCEITETAAMDDIKATQVAFEGLARIGVFLSIDDFGTGHSSLSYLRQLPARQLKIDRSFVQDLQSSSDARAVVEAVVRLAHALGLRVVAEGVETRGQRDALVDMGCDEMQGFLFASPMPAKELLQWAVDRGSEGSADFAPSVVGALPSHAGD